MNGMLPEQTQLCALIKVDIINMAVDLQIYNRLEQIFAICLKEHKSEFYVRIYL